MRLSCKIFRIFRQEAKNTRVPTLGTLVQYITSPCPVAAGCGALWASSRLSTPVHKKCIFSRKKFVQPVRSVLVRTRTANRDKLRRVIVYISGFRTPYEPYRLFELRTRFFRMRTEQSSSHCANLSGRGPSILLRKTVLSLKSPTGAFIVPLRSTNANCLLLRLRRNKQHDCHKNI